MKSQKMKSQNMKSQIVSEEKKSNNINFPSSIESHSNKHLKQCLGEDGLNSIFKSKVLVVGAGGIGCELLKNLILSGFQDIEIIDLDTIDLSNLNRQFLFQRKHIGQSKAQIAKEAVQRFNPNAKIVSYCANIKNAEYGAEFFKKFDLVLNALDNLDARRHVNRICVGVNIPLIESGTAGYLGQVQPIQKGISECYECQPKPTPKTYAYCTIRSNPKEPIHCVVWAKEEFNSYFGNPANRLQDDDTLADDPEIKREASVLQNLESNFSEWLFHKLFYFDIFSKIRVAEKTGKNPWTDRSPPSLLLLNVVLKETSSTEKTDSSTHPDQVVWSLKENAEKFLVSATKLKLRSEKGFLEFEKDDKEIMDFVTAASNIRSYIFGIPLQSKFSVKSMAGNIIPAIATTNAIIAGLIVIEAIKVLQKKNESLRMVYLQKLPSQGRLLLSTELEKPNPNCYVCSSHMISIKLDIQRTTVDSFISVILKKKLGFNEPTLLLGNNTIYESGEGLEEDEKELYLENSKKNLSAIGITNNTILEVDDYSQKLKLNITLIHCNQEEFPEEEESFEIIGSKPQAVPIPKVDEKPSNTSNNNNNKLEEEDDIVLASEQKKDEKGRESSSKKRKLEEGPSNKKPSKQVKISEEK